MDRIRRLSGNQSATEFFTCQICTAPTAVSADDMCDYCWYDFKATEEERRSINDLNIFRELSVHQWYSKMHVTKLLYSLLSPITVMHILHDCFRLSSRKPQIDYCLETATNMFPESVPWLRRLMKGRLPVVLQVTSTERIYKFAAGIGRTPIWYKVVKDESNSIPEWSWTPYNPTADFTNTSWIVCPQLLVTLGEYTNQVPVADNIFIIIFLHIFRPDPPIGDMNTKLDSNQLIRNHIREDVRETLPNLEFRSNKV